MQHWSGALRRCALANSLSLLPAESYAGNNFGSLNRSSQAILAAAEIGAGVDVKEPAQLQRLTWIILRRSCWNIWYEPPRPNRMPKIQGFIEEHYMG